MFPFNKETVCDLVRKELVVFPLYRLEHRVNASPITNSKYWIGYRTVLTTNKTLDTTHLDINIIRDVCFLTSIELEPSQRGKGLGRQLYGIVEEIAKALECTRVRMTPSGWTIYGRTRKAYMHDLGYSDDGLEVEKIFNRV